MKCERLFYFYNRKFQKLPAKRFTERHQSAAQQCEFVCKHHQLFYTDFAGEKNNMYPCYFSVQNSTFFPSRIIFVVRTAHILPHMEQVWRSAGGVLSK